MNEAILSAKQKIAANQALNLDMAFVPAAERACQARVGVGGDLKQGAAGIEGIEFEISLAGKPVEDNYCGTWNNNRRYSCTFPGGQSFTVKPVKVGTVFSLAIRSYTKQTKDDRSADFEAR